MRIAPVSSRRDFLSTLVCAAPLWSLAGVARAADSNARSTGTGGHAPGAGAAWARHESPEKAGFSRSSLDALEEVLFPLPTTSLMIVRGGKVAYTYGETSHISYLASARKSVMSLLYGKYVEAGAIDLNRTMGDLGIDDLQGLLPIEKTATIRHLLLSSSGIYHPAGSPGSSPNTPPRGSKKPGEYFFYNNWDFNVAGTVFEKLTGKSVFQALAEDLAGPLQFEDFEPARQRMLGYDPERSRHKAYHLFLSGRDLARLGQLVLNGGRWNGK